MTCAGVDANAEQVRRGWAWVYIQYAPKNSPLYALEREATGKDFLRTPEAIGLPLNAQEKLLDCVTGRISFQGAKKRNFQKTWGSIGEFLNDMTKPLNRGRINLSDEAWRAIARQFGRLSTANLPKQ